MKKKSILTKSELRPALAIISVENGSELLKTNAQSSVNYQNLGTELIGRIRRDGMDEMLVLEARGYVTQCTSGVQQMHALRKPFTSKLTEIQRQFVALEKEIDPSAEGSPAFEVAGLLRDFLRQQTLEAEATGQRIEINHERTEKRINARIDLSDTEKQQAMHRADNRLIAARVKLKLSEIPVHYIPFVTEPDGYIALFRYWWTEIGHSLPDSDLQRIFRPMLSFARKQARKGIRVDNECVEYRAEPHVLS